ncbi:MAG: WG repeat-containing protein [Crocinitomicaceae bacterium]|nr:WG repeat-containing protein [Crocinitomicaceae bacterium]
MKVYLIIIVLVLNTLSLAQSTFPITEKDGKYGYSVQYGWESSTTFQIPPIYDTLYNAGAYGSHSFVVGLKGTQPSLFCVSESGNSYIVTTIDTLDITHLQLVYPSRGAPETVATNEKGEAFVYTYMGHFEPLKPNLTVVVRKNNGKYQLMKNGKLISKDEFDYLDTQPNYFIGTKGKEIYFLNDKGKLLYDEPVTAYLDHWTLGNYIIVKNGNKKGYFKLDGSESLPLIQSTTPDRFWKPDDYYGGQWKYFFNTFYAVGAPGKMGLCDKSGKEIWPKIYNTVIVGIARDQNYVLKKAKKKWELFDKDLNLIGKPVFDEFVGSNEHTAYVRYKKTLFELDPLTGEKVALTSEIIDGNYKVILSDRDQVGVISSNGTLLIPCEFKNIRDHHEDILHVQTDSGYIAIDKDGKIASPIAFDMCWKIEGTDSVYVYQVGDKWGVFTLNDIQGFGPIELWNPYRQFNIDVEAHTNLSNYYVFLENAKCGIMTNTGKVILPAQYDKIYKPHYSRYEVYIGTKGDALFIIKPESHLEKETSAQYFIEYSDDLGYIFAQKNKLLCLDPVTLEENNYVNHKYGGFHELRPNEILHSTELKGVNDYQGNIILPIQYYSIRRVVQDTNPYIIAMDTNFNKSFFTTDGEAILKDYWLISNFCTKYSNLLFICQEKKGSGYLATWNATTKKLSSISSANVKDVTCRVRKKLEYIAEIEFVDGSKGFLYEDLRIEVEK